MSDPAVEELSAELHAIYQQEARRQAGVGDDEVRHPDDYDALPEHTKEYDRVLARFILAREERAMRVIQAARAWANDAKYDETDLLHALREWDGDDG